MVVHCKKSKYDIYIGRPSKWGNPFEVKDHGRDRCVELYKEWLWKQIKSKSITIQELADLHGKVLGCWCFPKNCHGYVLQKAAVWAHKKIKKTT